jgi:soluble lytic murein transglycosylase-like protein
MGISPYWRYGLPEPNKAGVKERLRPLLGLALSVVVCGAAHAQIYRYVDEKGLIHLTNIPRAGMRAVGKPAVLAAPQRYREYVEEAARRYQLSAELIHAVILTESGYRPDAVSPKGAVGLMQLMPQTARRYGVTDIRDPAQNIRVGAQYLRDLMERFDHDLELSLAAYNAGEAAVMRHGGIPPYAETGEYVKKVLDHYARAGASR